MSTLGKLLLTVVVCIGALIPLALFIGARSLLSPEGFLQNLFVVGVGFWIFSGTQLTFALVGLVLIAFIWMGGIGGVDIRYSRRED